MGERGTSDAGTAWSAAESGVPEVTLAVMPQHVLSMILAHLSHKELSAVACACRFLAEAAHDPRLWENVRLSVPAVSICGLR